MRKSLFGIIAILAGTVPVLAQTAAWDGTWVGTTAKGGAVQITISGDQATQYNFRGEQVPINQSGSSGKSFQLDVGSGHGTIRLTMAGKRGARFSYKDPEGGSATATLTRQ